MASFSTSNVLATSTKVFMEGLTLAVNDDWRRIFDFRNDSTSRLRISSLTGISDPGLWDSGNAKDDLPKVNLSSEGAVDLSWKAYGVQVQIHKYDVMDVPGIVDLASRKLGQAVAHKYRSLAYDEFTGSKIFASTTTADGVAVCHAQHTTALGGTNYRSNLLSSALDRTSFLAALRMGKKWTNFQNQYTNLFDGDVALVCSPEQEANAVEFLQAEFNTGGDKGSTATGTEGSENSMQANSIRFINGGNFVDLIVSPFVDANDWFLVSKMETPLRFWERSMPMLTAHTDSDERSVRLGVDFACVATVGPAPDGIIGSNV